MAPGTGAVRSRPLATEAPIVVSHRLPRGFQQWRFTAIKRIRLTLTTASAGCASEDKSPAPVHKSRISRTHIHSRSDRAAGCGRRPDGTSRTTYRRIRSRGAEPTESGRIINGEVRGNIG